MFSDVALERISIVQACTWNIRCYFNGPFRDFEYSLAYDTEISDWTVSQLSVVVANTRDRRAKREALPWLMVPEIVRLGLVAFGPEVRQLHGGESMAEAGSKGANRERGRSG